MGAGEYRCFSVAVGRENAMRWVEPAGSILAAIRCRRWLGLLFAYLFTINLLLTVTADAQMLGNASLLAAIAHANCIEKGNVTNPSGDPAAPHGRKGVCACCAAACLSSACSPASVAGGSVASVAPVRPGVIEAGNWTPVLRERHARYPSDARAQAPPAESGNRLDDHAEVA